ncbi:hypothetical protein GC163_09785 [bacterium]|nr:hypothetical protein [bacterium]
MKEPALSFRVWAQPWRWWFKPGCPPPLQDERAWVRELRGALFFGLLGTLSATLSSCWLMIHQLVFVPLKIASWPNFLEISHLVTPGLWFGLVVLLPLSRWRGRNWLVSLLAIPVSGGCQILGFVLWQLLVPPYLTAYPILIQPPGNNLGGYFGWCLLGMFGAALLQLWMREWKPAHHRLKIWPIIAAGGVGGCVSTLLGGMEPQTLSPQPEILFYLMFYQRCLQPFQMLVAIALARSLWSQAILVESHPLATTSEFLREESELQHTKQSVFRPKLAANELQ